MKNVIVTLAGGKQGAVVRPDGRLIKLGDADSRKVFELMGSAVLDTELSPAGQNDLERISDEVTRT